MSLEYFIKEVANRDFFRKNMFSVALSDGPGNKISSTFDNIVSPLYTDSWLDKSLSQVGINTNKVIDFASDITNKSIRRWGNNNGRNFLTAMNSGIVKSFLGEFAVGEQAVEFFSSIDLLNYDVVSVQLPESDIVSDYTMNDTGGYSDKTGMFNPGYLSITFRQTVNGKMYQVFKDYMRLIHNPDTGLKAFHDDVCCNISVNEHERNGAPVLIHQFEGCKPVSLSGMEYSYDSDNELQTFTVRFSFRSYNTGSLGRANSEYWLQEFGSAIAAKAGTSLGDIIGQKVGNPGRGRLNSSNTTLTGLTTGLASGLTSIGNGITSLF